MAITTRLELRQSQQLVMTPQLQQAIRLLQLSNLELCQFVDAELERNPLLEREEPEPPVAGPEEGGRGAEEPVAASAESWLDLANANADPTGTFDTEIENVFPDASSAEVTSDLGGSGWASLRPRSGNFADEDTNLESYVASEVTLKGHLEQQLALGLEGHVERLIGRHLIDLVDEAGYLTADLDQLAARLGAPAALVGDVLATLQTFDPPGVFARSLAECLAIQLKDRNRYDPCIAALLDNLHLLAGHNLGALRRAVNVEMY